MRRHGMIGLAAAAALVPASATLAETPRTWGNVPNVALQPPQGATGWRPGGWQGGPPPAPVAGSPAYGAPVLTPPPHPGGPGMAMAHPVGPGGPGGPGGVTMHRGQPGPGMGYARGSRGGMGRGGYANGGYANGGGGYRGGGLYSVRRGDRLPGTFLAPTYFISNWGLYGLPAPGLGFNWVRYYNGAALIDSTGTVLDYRDSVNWGGSGLAGPGYGGPGFGGSAFGSGRGPGGPGAGPGDRAYAAGYDDGYDDGFDDGVDYAEDAVTYRGKWQHGGGRVPSGHPPVFQHPPVPGYNGGSYGYNGYGSSYGGYGYQGGYAAGGAQVYSSGGATVVVVQGAPAVTTTTTTVEETVSYAAARKRVWKKPVRTWRPRPRCVCTWK